MTTLEDVTRGPDDVVEGQGDVAEGQPVGHEDAPRPLRQRVATVLSPKGGTGSTALAVNLAAALHAADQRVCLVDLDLEFGDVAVSLRLDPVTSIADAVDLPPGEEWVTDLVTEYRPGFDCVLAPIEPAAADEVPDALVGRLLAELRSRYDVVIVDAQHRFSDHVLAAIDGSDDLLLVATPEITSLKNIRICLDVLDLLEHPESARHLVLQKDDMPSGLTADEVATALRLPFDLTIPHDDAVTRSGNDGTPLTYADPTGPVGRAIQRFATTTFLPEVAAAEASNRRRRRFGRKS